MKRLILLTLILTPLALHALRASHPHHRPHQHIGPRRHAAPVITTAFSSEEAAQEQQVESQPRATPERARADADRALREAVSRWIARDGVPTSWAIPPELLREAVRTATLDTRERDYGTVYVQTVHWNRSAELRERLLETYEREVAGRRLLTLGGVLSFILVCLGTLFAYIRADEATRGYYTNRLRLAAAAGVGAASVALYRFLA